MALPPCISKCSPARAPPIHRSQVGAGRYLSSSIGWGSLSLWALSYHCSYLVSQRSSMGKVMAMEGKKQAAQGGENKRREVKFNSADLMELEFGRLLGEPNQATLAKVLGRKVNPEVSYIDIEKRPLKKIEKAVGGGFPETDFSRLLNQEGKPATRPPNAIKPAARNSVAEKVEDLPGLVAPARPGVGLSETDFSRLLNQEGSLAPLPPRVVKPTVQNSTAEKCVDLPDLIAPPPRLGVRIPQAPRPTSAVRHGNGASTAQGKKAVPTVTFGPGGFAAQSKRQKVEEDYMGLVRKPTIGSEDSYTPSWPTNEIIPPMLIGKPKQSGDAKSDALLRRPTVSEMSPSAASSGSVDTDVKSSRQGGAKLSSAAAKPVFEKHMRNSHVKVDKVDVPFTDMSDERFARLLELAGTSDSEKDQEGLSESTTAPTSASVYPPSRKKPLPKLGSKPLPVVKLPSKPFERKEGDEETGQSSVSTSNEDVSKPSDCFPAVDQGVTMLQRETKPTISTGRNEMAKRPIPLNAQKPIPRSSSPSNSTAEVTKPSPERATSERETESTVNTSSKEMSISTKKQPTVAQRPTLRPFNVVISSTSPLEEVDEASMSTLSTEVVSKSSISSPLVDVETSTLERKKEPTVSALDKEVLVSAKRAAPAIQMPILRPSNSSTPSSSSNKVSECTSADRIRSSGDQDSALESSTSSVVQSAAPLATASGVENQMISKLEQKAEKGVIHKGLRETTRTDNVQMPVNRPVFRLAKTISSVAPVRLQTPSVPSKPSTSLVSDPVNSEGLSFEGDILNDRKSKNFFATEFGEPGDVTLGDTERSTGRSEEVEAAVGRNEGALQQEERKTPTETEYDRSLQQQKLNETFNLLKRPLPPPAPSSKPLPSPLDDIMRQLSAARPVVNTSSVKTDNSPAVKLQRPEAVLFDKKETPSKEEEDQDWARAEALLESKMIEEVVFAASNAVGMLVSFGSLVGFLPSWELSGRRRPPSFTTWAQENGSTTNQPKPSSRNKDLPTETSETGTVCTAMDGTQKVNDEGEHMKLLQQYRDYRARLLSALVGESAKAMVIGLERERRQLRLSEKVAEGEGQELAQKKAQLMANLNVGDIVTCTVKKVTTFGAFVELQGVPALIHISELSWNRITDPTTILSVGQEVETKVCRLDRFLQRINLSFKQMQPDPLRETLESLVSNDGDEDVADLGPEKDDGQEDIAELSGVIKRLEAYKGIESVRKGRRIQGTALAPTFQVYLSAQLNNGYKLLARSRNQVQEVLVQTALDRDSMKDAIRDCTFSED